MRKRNCMRGGVSSSAFAVYAPLPEKYHSPTGAFYPKYFETSYNAAFVRCLLSVVGGSQ